MNVRFSRFCLAIAFAAGSLVSGVASALPITKTVGINVYQLCDDAGANCAATGPAGNDYFFDSTNKIWEQAGISVSFNFVSQINSTQFLDIDESVTGDGLWDLQSAYGYGPKSATFIDMFLVRTVAGAYGEGWAGSGGLAMAMQTIMDFNGGLGRIDTLAHELGHNLGLEPTSLGGVGWHSTDPNNLMASGGIRHVPSSLADISPDGLAYDRLTQGQIDLVLQSTLLRDAPAATVPEPASTSLLAIALLALGLSRRRRSV